MDGLYRGNTWAVLLPRLPSFPSMLGL